MNFRAKYYANLRDGKSIYLCSGHIEKVARKIDDAGHMQLKRGVRSIGSLSIYSRETCVECRRNHGWSSIPEVK